MRWNYLIRDIMYYGRIHTWEGLGFEVSKFNKNKDFQIIKGEGDRLLGLFLYLYKGT